jgi:hypothetical protein
MNYQAGARNLSFLTFVSSERMVQTVQQRLALTEENRRQRVQRESAEPRCLHQHPRAVSKIKD